MSSTLTINQFIDKIKKNGVKFLLPQNLDEESLDRLLKEVNSLEDDSVESTPAIALLIAVLHLKAKKILKLNKKISICPKKLMKYFDIYTELLRLEAERRLGMITIEDDSLPNIRNIFDTIVK